jgi:hypothetical protein
MAVRDPSGRVWSCQETDALAAVLTQTRGDGNMADVANMVEVLRYRTKGKLWKAWGVIQAINKQAPSLGIQMVQEDDCQVFVVNHGISSNDATALEKIIRNAIMLLGTE